MEIETVPKILESNRKYRMIVKVNQSCTVDISIGFAGVNPRVLPTAQFLVDEDSKDSCVPCQVKGAPSCTHIPGLREGRVRLRMSGETSKVHFRILEPFVLTGNRPPCTATVSAQAKCETSLRKYTQQQVIDVRYHRKPRTGTARKMKPSEADSGASAGKTKAKAKAKPAKKRHKEQIVA